jgi:hypothetical protein
MRKIFIVAVYVLNGLAVFSQEKFLNGFIVKAEGDTLRGQVAYRKWDRNPVRITFRKSETSAPEIYYPLQVRSFSVADEYYEGAVVDVDISPYKIGELDQKSEPDFVKDTVFLQVLVREQRICFT